MRKYRFRFKTRKKCIRVAKNNDNLGQAIDIIIGLTYHEHDIFGKLNLTNQSLTINEIMYTWKRKKLQKDLAGFSPQQLKFSLRF